jgi:hypothetical protein
VLTFDLCLTLQTFKIDEECLSQCLALNYASNIGHDQLVALLMRRENHPLRVAYELILDHKNAKIRIDGASVWSSDCLAVV